MNHEPRTRRQQYNPNDMPERRLYFDNAATSFPKPPEVAQAMLRYMNEIGASPGRGGYAEALEAGRIVTRCRELINRLIGGESPSHVVLTLNASDAMNLALKGVARHHLRRGEPVHIITTHMDHNAALRPLRELGRDGVDVTRVEIDPASGRLDPESIVGAMRTHTRLVVMTHASNVTGIVQPAREVGDICRQRNVLFLLDAAQTLGHMPMSVGALNVDLLAFPGHKGLLGPLGTGGLYIRPGLERGIDTLREGGTGSASESDSQPQVLPDKYEPGSPNGPGIAGLAAAVQWIMDRGLDDLWEHERRLMAIMLDGLRAAPGVRLVGAPALDGRIGVISLTVDGFDPNDVAAILEEHYGVLVRAGLQCAPLAHQAMGTLVGGTLRLSVGPFITEDDARYAVSSMIEIAGESGVHAASIAAASHP
jgi:cysteine desulfurase family protein